MKPLLCLLAVLGWTATMASAGPNANGVLWVHDTGIVFSTDLTLPPESSPPSDCDGVDNLQDADGVARVWKVYAAFPPGSHPRLKTAGWATQFPEATTSAYSYVHVAGGGAPDEDGPGTDFFIGDLGFPTSSGGQIGQSFPTGPRTTTVVTLFYFYGFGYHANGPLPTWGTAPHGVEANRVFGDDAFPANEDPILRYGSLGFGHAGMTPCPTTDPDGACCAPLGGCTITNQAACTSPSEWHVLWPSCDPNPCPLPTGACCFADGGCLQFQESPCGQAGGAYHGDLISCDPDPCPGSAVCCLWDGTCVFRTEPACAAFDPPGIWHPAWTSCAPNPCPQIPTGACCTAENSCTLTTEAACYPPRIWHEEWPSCEPNPCPQQVFACCNVVDGTCAMTTRAECVTPTHVWHASFTCDTYPCPPAAPTGACCLLDGTCSMEAEVLCPTTGHDPGVWHPTWTSCDPNPCPPWRPGACCAWTGLCTVTMEDDCLSPDYWIADRPTCSPNPCLGSGSLQPVTCWGANQYGQCDPPPGNYVFTAIAAGSGHSLGIRRYTILAWGLNDDGQCDVPAPNANFVALAAGGRHSMGLKSDGSIVAWGRNDFGQCDVPAPNGDFVALAAGGRHSMGLKSDGSIVAWGRNDFGQCDVPAPNTGFVAISGGYYHSLGLRADGTIVAWGATEDGLCSVPEPNACFVAVAAGTVYSLGLHIDGTVAAWGPYAPFFSPETGCVAFSAGSTHAMGLYPDETVQVAGDNAYHQCEVPGENADFVEIAAGGAHCLAIRHGMGSPPPPRGACCSVTGACTLMFQEDCHAPSDWQGADTACEPNPCPQPPTPILLESWTASSLAEGLQIRWEVPLGTTGAQYRTWRDPEAGAHDPGPTPQAALVSAAWTNASPEGIIEILDRGAPRGATIRYFLESGANGVVSEFIGPVEARWDPPALVWSVGPTPFRDAVRLVPPGTGPARAEVFDPAGRLVRTLQRNDGSDPLEWDGRDGAGQEAPTGVYLVRLASASDQVVKRLVKIR